MRILMVCLGNICRSPLAEGILADKTKHLNLEVESAGISAYHVGQSPDIRSIEIAIKYNIDLSKQKARQFNKLDFDRHDIIYAMDTDNYAHLINLTSNDYERNKIKLILNEINPGLNKSVPDPYYGGENGFQDVYNMLNQACNKIVQNIEKR